MSLTNSEKNYLQALAVFVAVILLASALMFPSKTSLFEGGFAAILISLAVWKLRVRKRKRSFSFYSELEKDDHDD
jgi:hypothetical protein